MSIYLIFLSVLSSLFVFLVPRAWKYWWIGVWEMVLIIGTSFGAGQILLGHTTQVILPLLNYNNYHLEIFFDPLSTFFVLVINFTMFTAFWYSKGYYKKDKQTSVELSLHWLSFFGLHFGMLFVVLFQNGWAFLWAWELMTISSFLLIIFEGRETSVRRAGWQYFLQMHGGFFCIMAAFFIAATKTGLPVSWESVAVYFSNHNNLLVFFLFFTGFGMKAGFIPLHSWLPHAHPASPSPISGAMSGVMIKMGIYGILRVIFLLHNNLGIIAGFLIIISIISGLFGVMNAIFQHDIKKLLAYHSIENIGIIGLGIGLGLLGIKIQNPVLAILGFSGGILHILNHALFKSLLFYAAGNIYKAIHTRNIEKMGGLIHRLPKTAILFLIGSLAISGLPPFNGFISEYLIYLGIFRSIGIEKINIMLLLLFSLLGLVLIGGMAVFCFSKIFGIVFCGHPRAKTISENYLTNKNSLYPLFLIVALMISIGICPSFIVSYIATIVNSFVKIPTIEVQELFNPLEMVGFASLAIFGIGIGMFLLKKWYLKIYSSRKTPTWGCGYQSLHPEKFQYTGSSFAQNFLEVIHPLLNVKVIFEKIKRFEIFASSRNFFTEASDVFESKFRIILRKFIFLVKKTALFHRGDLRQYVSGIFIFIITILLLTFFNII